MIKSDFISSLRQSLACLDREELEKFITYYEELIADYKEDGLTEAEILNKIGSPQYIASNILKEHNISNTKESPSSNKTVNRILLILGLPLWGSLLLAAVLIILSIYLIIWCIPFSTGVTSIALLLGSFISLIGSPFVMAEVVGVGIVQLGMAFLSLGLSILLGLLTFYLSKKFSYITKESSKYFVKLFNMKAVKLW